MDQLVKQRKQAQTRQQVANILLEFYYCEGPVHLLDAVRQLYDSSLRWAIVSDIWSMGMAFAYYGDVLFAYYELRNDTSMLNKSIECYYNAIRDSSEFELPRSLIGLARALFCRFLDVGQENDCRTAVDILEAVWQSTTVYGLDRVWVLTILAFIRTQISTNFVITIAHSDVKVILHRLISMPRSHLPKSKYVLCLLAEANLNNAMYNETLYHEYLEEGLRLAQLAIELVPEGAHVLTHQACMTFYRLHSMAWIHCKKLDHRRMHVDQGIQIASNIKSSALARLNNHIYREALHDWAIASLAQSPQLEDLSNMEQAVGSLKEAYSMCPPSHIAKAVWANHLAVATTHLFERSGRLDILDELAILRNQGSNNVVQGPFLTSSVMEVMLSRVNTADYQNPRLGITWTSQLRQDSMFESTVSFHRDSMKARPDTQMIAASYLWVETEDQPLLDNATLLKMAHQNLVKAQSDPSAHIKDVLAQVDLLICQAHRTPNFSYSLILAEYIIKKELSGYMHLTIYRADLLAAQADLMVFCADLQDLESNGDLLATAWETYQLAATSTSGRTTQRFQACLRWASHAQNHGHVKDAFAAYSCAIKILPNVIFLGEDITGRIEALQHASGLAASSAVLALNLGDISAALDFLEQTRGILWLQSFQMRTQELERLPVTLKNEFERIVDVFQGEPGLQWSLRQHKATELEQVVFTIQALPGYERFLLPPLLCEIEDALWQRESYAIVVIPGTSHCDVLVLGVPGKPVHLRNSLLGTDRLLELAQSFDTQCSIARKAQRDTTASRKVHISHIPDSGEAVTDQTSALLAELWLSLVLPIIKHLDLPRFSHSKSLKRVWWCPIGAVSSLPLHAAGVFEGSTRDHVGNYMVSSYTPTLTALHRLLQRQNADFNDPGSGIPRVLLLAQPRLEGNLSLPNAQAELDVVRTLIPAQCMTNSRDQTELSIEEALQGAMAAHIFHLACHGHQDQEHPLKSGFDVRDGRLTIAQLMKISTPYAQLAYLSACESARVDTSRPDQILHLAATMIFIGFKSVIGTMWAMDDIDGPFMAKRIYKRIFQNGTVDMSAVPFAVHEAIKELRESGVPASRWATYVHFGV